MILNLTTPDKAEPILPVPKGCRYLMDDSRGSPLCGCTARWTLTSRPAIGEPVTVAVCRRHANLAEKWHHLLVDVQDPSPSKAEEK
jgi:hypothetical protein